ncbi:hypothetical protein D9M71_677110 [compost metagenome]
MATDQGVLAVDVACHEGQTGNAEGGEVIVVAQLPGLHFFPREGAVVRQVDHVRVLTHEGEFAIAGNLLVGAAEFVTAHAQAEHAVEVVVVDAAHLGGAVVTALKVAKVGAQTNALAQRPGVDKAGKVLAVDILQLGIVVAGGEVLVEVVAAASEIQVIAFHATAVIGDAVVAAGVA